MLYLVSLLTTAASLVVLLVLVVWLSGPLRRLTGTASLCGAYLAGRLRLLKARITGLKAELRRRRRLRSGKSSGDPTAA